MKARFKKTKIGETRKRNTPIATLISLYEDKRSGKVMNSRKEIQWRFEALDWEHQQHILTDFLKSGKLDRAWACEQLRDLWDPIFEPKIKELWEHYHEDACKWVVIRHMPTDYVQQHMQEFIGQRDYFYICLRLAQDKDYQIETDKLSIADYLAVLFHTGRDFDDIDINSIYLQIVRENCLRPLNAYDFGNSFDRREPTDILCPDDLRDIERARYYLSEIKFAEFSKYELNLWRWNKRVKGSIIESKEYHQLTSSLRQSAYFHFEQWICDISRKYFYIALPDEYKLPSDPSPDDMVKPQEEYWFGKKFETIYESYEEQAAAEEETDELPFPPSIGTEENDVPF